MWTETHRARLMRASAALALGLSLPAHANAAGMFAPGPAPTPLIIQIDGENGGGGKGETEHHDSDADASSDSESTGSTGTDASGTDPATDSSSTDSSTPDSSDTGSSDTGSSDTGSSDTGSSDTGTGSVGGDDVSPGSEMGSAPDESESDTGSSASSGSSVDVGGSVGSSDTGISTDNTGSGTIDTSQPDTSPTQSDTTTSTDAPSPTGAALSSSGQPVDAEPSVEPPSPGSASAEIREAATIPDAPGSTAPLPSIIQPARDNAGRVAEAPALCMAGAVNCVSADDTTAASSAMSRQMHLSQPPAVTQGSNAIRPAATQAQPPALAGRPALGISLVNPVRGQGQILVQGIIVNTSNRVQAVPPMRILLKNKADQSLQRWEMNPPVTQLAPGQYKAFKAVLKPTPPDSSRVDVAFIAAR